MEKENRLGTEKIPKLLVEFAIPAIIGMMVNGIYNIVDRIFIGNDPTLGSLGLAAVSITYPVTLVLLAFALMVAVGGATIFSISLGKKETDKAQHYLGNALTLAIILGALFMIFGNIFIEPILVFLGASADVLPYAEEYLSIILYGAIFQAIAMTLNNFARADGSPRISMISMLIGAGFNIVFDYIFIVQMGWGMAGAAYATIGGQFLSMVWQLAYFLSTRSNVKLKLKNMALKKIYIISILSIGIPAFMLQIANSVLNIILNNTLVNYGGDVAVSVAGIITSAVTLIVMFVSGLIQGMQPITSYNYGARNGDRVKEVLKVGSIIGGVITTVGFLVIQLFPEFVVMLFNQEPAVVELGVPAIRIWVLAFPMIGVQIVWANYFQAIGEVRLASFLNLMRQVIVLIPLILLFSNLFGLYGIYVAVPTADLFAFAITAYFFKRQFKRDKF
ncbi:MATE family efflux transporter [Desemzia sp. RIT804]|uniref:MATE family efflux transporter n=1 Tax=Desemzia sp. RIT 804 TaxID=2810209 RepID=UPI0019529FEA|nr:MATE family efflux transporter [Desemzia sp. RIT 804]MBM6614331.1 MATE family efflux transporter [Desemzia sp. RIT 804]